MQSWPFQFKNSYIDMSYITRNAVWLPADNGESGIQHWTLLENRERFGF